MSWPMTVACTYSDITAPNYQEEKGKCKGLDFCFLKITTPALFYELSKSYRGQFTDVCLMPDCHWSFMLG